MNPDLEIARAATLKPIADIAARLNIPAEALEPYGRHKAKIGFEFINSVRDTLATGAQHIHDAFKHQPRRLRFAATARLARVLLAG